MTAVHIINHTHWDREWFLTHEYTTAWIPALIESIQQLSTDNPDYEFLIDGQSLVVEDLLATRPDHRDRLHHLVGRGNLTVGPLYSQPDWRMVTGELHLRNLRYGITDAESLGGTPDVAWLVDTFGHPSQAPQMLTLAGIDAAFVWRGVPTMTPVFAWEGADGSRMPAIDLFGGYRNLYGVTKTADIAADRLVAEVDKLAGSYGDIPIPLFDGYDLDTEPEDPVRFYDGLDLPDRIEIVASSPRRYVDAVADHLETAPVIHGELISGKYGSTFPGSLSARTYLKVLHNDAERALFRRVEPLATLAAALGVTYDHEAYESAGRELLRNGVHDCLCGVSIDQVHERMERSYRRLLDWADGRQRVLTTTILGGFAPGSYAVSTNPIPMSTRVRTSAATMLVDSEGIGVTQVVQQLSVRRVDAEVDRFEWENSHYSAAIDKQGLRVDGNRHLLRMVVRADAGDTYSSEPGAVLGELQCSSIVHVDETDVDSTVRFELEFTGDALTVTATVDARFDDGPVVDLTVALDSTGTGFRVDAEFETGVEAPRVRAGMPFDVLERDHDDNDLLGQSVAPEIAAILMGQRETGHVTEFPFHDFVALDDGTLAAAVLAQGIRSYRSTALGTITVTLRRAVEWLALTDLSLRSGDAGPAMYVPGARCERRVIHRLGFAALAGRTSGSTLATVSEAFHNPPLIAEVTDGDPAGPSTWSVYSSPLPATGLFRDGAGESLLRFYNPNDESVELDHPFARRSLRGVDLGAASTVRAKEIVTAAIPIDPPAFAGGRQGRVSVDTPVVDRGGRSRSRPDAAELADLDRRVRDLEQGLASTIDELEATSDIDRWMLTHRRYVLERELLELRLSRELNERLLHSEDEVSIPDEVDPVIADLGSTLNDLRVKRRIYDYVVQALSN